ncbi:MAG: MAE_28990/MAE_18760 family HEPN-like nuclease [Gemmatimonas sp.]
MTKARSESDLSNQFDSDMGWRIKEISDLRSVIERSDQMSTRALLRALIPILYAHWEGHVRFCAQKYFEFICLRRYPFSALEKQSYVNHFLVRLENFSVRRPNLKERAALLSQVLGSQDARFSKIDPTLIDTRSNLNSDVLQDICIVCAVDYSRFAEKADFLDRIILKRRNSIAHGEEVYIAREDLESLIADVIGLMRLFRNLLENKIYEKTYLAA